jgi:VRR-NUC domain-containing protein
MRRRQHEQPIQRALVEHLRLRAVPHLWWCHIPNNPRSAIAGAMLKAAGLKAGAPDLIFIRAGRTFALELKAARGRVSPVQKVCHDELRAAGAEVAVATGIDQALTQLEAWGLLR